MAILWACLSLVFASFNDLLFKFYARKPRSNGWFAAVVGVVSTIFTAFFIREAPANWQATILWGCIGGFFSIGANLLMLDAMHTLDAGVCSTIYRLNMVPAVVGAALILGESVSPMTWCGILFALLAVIGFIPQNKNNGGENKRALAGFICMIIASLMRAAMGLTYSAGFHAGADKTWVSLITTIAWIIGGPLYALYEKRYMKPEPPEDRKKNLLKLLGYGALSGVLVPGIVLCMAFALNSGKASVLLPFMQMSFILTAIFGMIFLKEKMTLRRGLSIASGATAVLILSLCS